MSNILCPVCGSHNLSTKVQTQSEQLTLGPEFHFEEVVYTCEDCESEGDFASENDSRYLVAHKGALNISVKSILDSLSGEDAISMAYLERAFELPVRTATRWKSGDYSASALALLRTVKTFPWLADVADHKFEKNYASSVLMREAFKLARNVFERHHETKLDLSIDSTPSTLSATATVTFKNDQPRPKLIAVGDGT